MQHLLQNATTQGAAAVNLVTPKKKDKATLKVSASEKANMLVMCGLPVGAGDKCFPKWFRHIFVNHVDNIGKAQIIARVVDASHFIDNAEVHMYPGITKTIMKRDWTASDLGKLAALVNAAKVIYSFSVVDLTEEDVAAFTSADDMLVALAKSSNS